MRKDEIDKEIKNLEHQREKIIKQEIKSITSFKLGDIVEFIIKGDSYRNEPDEWEVRSITKFELRKDGSVFANFSGLHRQLNVNDLKLYDANDFHLRHSFWNGVINIGDKIQLIVAKPKSTINSVYTVTKIIQEMNCETEYYYFNDYGKPQAIKEGEFYYAENPKS